MAVPALNGHSPLDSLARRTSAWTPDRTPRPQGQQVTPASPLLHSHFARDSTATASSNDNNSYLARTSIDSRNIYNDHELHYRYYDQESIYSTSTAPALRDSWQSADVKGPVESPIRTPTHTNQPPPTMVPTVIVSSPTDPDALAHASRGGRIPITKPLTSNFSRPRPPIMTTPEFEEQKRRVLERNQGRADSPTHRAIHQPRSNPPPGGTARPFSEDPRSSSKSPLRFEATRSHSPQTGHPYSSSTPPVIANRPSFHPPSGPLNPASAGSLRPVSPASIYSSTYSYYQLDSAAPSPTRVTFSDPPLDPSAFSDHPRPAPSPPKPQPPSSSTPATSNPHTCQEYLQLGIQHHEANRLKESAVCFEKSAIVEGGCGVGMLMWGLALRHGWGCEKNEKHAFKWLRRAAESAVSDLENARTGGGVNMSAVQNELVLAIYEVGQCFFQGWGVSKDQKMAVSYYTVAARLGDADAQSDLAFCLANGKGCKTDRKEAAKWYRAAVAQGQSDIGLAWIYKEKYQ